jgi:hypothetical protein
MMNKFILELLDVGCMEEIFALVQWVVELVTNIPPGVGLPELTNQG